MISYQKYNILIKEKKKYVKKYKLTIIESDTPKPFSIRIDERNSHNDAQ